MSSGHEEGTEEFASRSSAPSMGSSGVTAIRISFSDSSLYESQPAAADEVVRTRRTCELGGVDRFEHLAADIK